MNIGDKVKNIGMGIPSYMNKIGYIKRGLDSDGLYLVEFNHKDYEDETITFYFYAHDLELIGTKEKEILLEL